MVVSGGLQWTHMLMEDLLPDHQKGAHLQAGESKLSLLDMPDSENLPEHLQAKLRAGW